VPRLQVIFTLLAQKLETCKLGSYKMPTHTMRTRVNKRLDGGLRRLAATAQRTFAPCDFGKSGQSLRLSANPCHMLGKVETIVESFQVCDRTKVSQ
jgi:hypothetical protein